MKVLHIIGRFGGTGGAERSLQNLITAKRKNGYEQYVIGLQKAGVDHKKIKQSGIKLYELETLKLSSAIISVFKLAKLIRKIDPDVIQSWMYYADLFSIISLYISGKRKKIRLFWGIRSSNLNLSEYTLKLRIVVRLCKYFSHLPDGIKSHHRCNSLLCYGFDYLLLIREITSTTYTKSMEICSNGIYQQRTI